MKKFLIFILTLSFFGCKNEKNMLKSRTVSSLQAENAASKLAKPAGVCYCDPTADAAACNITSGAILAYLGQANTVTKTITWSNCTVQPTANDPSCNAYFSPSPTSQLTLCYYNCNTVTARISNRPACLPCLPQTVCIQLHAGTYNGNYVLQGGMKSDDGELIIEMKISADPNVTLTCSSGPTSNVTTYVCYGNY